MDLTKGQKQGLDMARRLVKADGHRIGILAGFAGTGKTTLLKTIAEETGMPVVITPTGKAAARVKQAAGIGAMTVHRWQYEALYDEQTGLVSFAKRPPDQLPQGESGLLVIEEASMIGRDLWNDILDNAIMLGLKVLCIGDPFQLPPVEQERDREPFSILDSQGGIAHEYVLMSEVMRQALESPVIRASMKIRDGDILGAMGILPHVKPKDFIDKGTRIQAQGGVVIVHRNETRHWANVEIRKVRGFPSEVQSGEPILVLKNQYDLQAFNGETYRFDSWHERTPTQHTVMDRWAKTREKTGFGIANLSDGERGLEFRGIIAEEELSGKLKSGFGAIEKTGAILFRGLPMIHANFGYAMTVHKAQGSEWPEVLVGMEPSIRFWGKSREESLRWMYTATTRSREKCFISVGVGAGTEAL